MQRNAHDRATDSRRAILAALKHRRSATVSELAGSLGMSYEAVRQKLTALESEGWVERNFDPPSSPAGGRPAGRFRLTEGGEHHFPKAYDELSIELVAQLDEDTRRSVLAAMTDARVRRWKQRLDGKSVEEKLELLKGLYAQEDPHMSVERNGDDGPRLVQRNCPYLNVALARPELCSLTTSVLARLLGYRVGREERFQRGDGCCAFHVLRDQPLPPDFRFDLERSE